MAETTEANQHPSARNLLDQPVIPDRFYVSKLGVMRLVVDKGTLTAYQVQAKDAAALCKLLNELDLRSRL